MSVAEFATPHPSGAPAPDGALHRSVTVEGLCKSFGGVAALKGASLDIRPGEVHALVGENGAGKSTLLRSLAGFVTPDEGTITIGNEVFEQLTPALSRAHRIAVVPQEIAFAPRLTVAESMAINSDAFPTRGTLVRWRALTSWAQGKLDEWELGISARAPMSTLTPAQHIAVAVISAVHLDAQLIILDEPTASFSPPEVEHLFKVVRRLRGEGRSVVYVTHRLDEVFAVCERVTVMREGQTIATSPIEEMERRRLVELIVGRSMAKEEAELEQHIYDAAAATFGDEVLRVDEISGGRVGPISFALRNGEILGFAGLAGSGRTELFELIYGVTKRTSGTITVRGVPRRIGNPSDARRLGMGLMPEERRRSGLVLDMSVRENAVLPTFDRYSHPVTHLLRRRLQRRDLKEVSERIRLRTPSFETRVGNLSGGNQQKVVIARWLNAGSDLLIFDEPTRGIDIGAKAEIFDLIREAVRDGASVLVASSEAEELVGLCHRIIVMREGEVVGELTGNEIEAGNIARACFGD